MISFKLIFRNVHKNIRDYLIYFLTLTLSVSLFYAFNSISDQPAFSDMGITGSLLYDQLGILLSALSVVIAVVLAFLIIYANQFLLKRRKKKELGVYMVLGMKKKDAFPGCLPVKLFVLVSLLWFQVWFLGCSFRKDFLWLH